MDGIHASGSIMDVVEHVGLHTVSWNYFSFLSILTAPVLFLVQVTALVPTNVAVITSWRDHFEAQAGLFFGAGVSFGLDQSLIQDVEFNRSHQRIVRAAIAMARGLDIEVAAEGVETTTQLEFLRSCNCDLAQGLLISRPMQADKVLSILRSEIAGTRLLARGMP